MTNCLAIQDDHITDNLDEERSRDQAIQTANQCLEQKTAEARVAWALETLPGPAVLSSSFGAQAAVSLHLLSQQRPEIPVILVDTGYLFPETYAFVDELTDRLKLNLKVYRSKRSPAWQESRDGERWGQGLDGINAYNTENKVEPMGRALADLQAGTWFAGLRRTQSVGRAERNVVEYVNARWKVHPIIDWTDRDIYNYLTKHNLPYHPLWEKGYISIGDVHSTRSLADVDSIEQTRFFGLTRECGLHTDQTAANSD